MHNKCNKLCKKNEYNIHRITNILLTLYIKKYDDVNYNDDLDAMNGNVCKTNTLKRNPISLSLESIRIAAMQFPFDESQF